MKFFMLSGMHLPDGYTRQIWRTMKLTFILLTAFFLHVSATTLAQQVTLKKDRITLKQAFTEIRKQTGFVVLYGADEVDVNKTVTLNLDHVALKDAMTKILEDQNLDFTIEDQSVVIKKKETTTNQPQNQFKSSALPVVVTGKVTNELGEPMAGVSIHELQTRNQTISDQKGNYSLTVSDGKAVVDFLYIGYEPQQIAAKDIAPGSVIILKPKIESLQEVVISKGYYDEKRALSTGDVSVVTAKDITDQPVTDPIISLEGKVPGLYISQTSGMPGAYSTIRIMGANSLQNGNDPLYIVDGIPFTSTSPTSLNFSSPLGVPNSKGYNTSGVSAHGAGMSPFNLLNPSDIESIELLKDADATAIYGSRGANGVVLITTRKGKTGDTRVNFDIAQGIGQVTRMLPMMNTQQYVQMRNEANTNGGFAAEPGYDVDLLNWDTTRNTNWQKALLGNNAHYTNANLSLSGGSTNTQFIMGGTFSRNTTVFPGDFADEKSSGYINITHHSTNQKFSAQLSVNYLYDNNALPGSDLTAQALELAPDAPSLTNKDGSLNWGYYQGSPTLVGNANPLVYTVQSYSALTDNLQTSLKLTYQLLPGLLFSTNLGYNRQNSQQTKLIPGTSVPIELLSTTTRQNFGANDLNSYWSIEPQLSYNKIISKGNLNVLLGTSFQSNNVNDASYSARGYTSDVQLSNPAAASSLTYNYLTSLYRYNAIYGRIGYTWDDKYILNVTARRDGSSRFGPGDQWGNFGSAGAGWIFSKEKLISDLSWLSFGKFRASYGITGNDQIGNYGYLTTYASRGTSSYQGSTLLNPSGLANPYYSWEHVKKLEAGVDLNFLKDRISVTATWFRNRDDDQLVGYILPYTTGFSTVQANLPASVQNNGWEFTATTQNIKANDFGWTTSFNLTLPQNKLLAFPNIQNSSYATTDFIGQSLFSQLVYHYTGVSPQTGQYTFSTQNANGFPSLSDRIISKPITQTAYGSLSNSFHYKDLQLDFMFYFVKQMGYNYLYAFNSMPGLENYNVPTYFLNAWQYPGQKVNVAQYNANYAMAGQAYSYISASDAAISDASFIRLRNVSLSYKLPQEIAKAITFQNLQIYMQGENLLTITGYKGLDPETQGLSLPPLRVITFGIKGTL